MGAESSSDVSLVMESLELLCFYVNLLINEVENEGKLDYFIAGNWLN